MPLNAMRRCEPLLAHMFKSLKPIRIIGEVGKGDRPSYYRNFKGYRIEKFGRPKLVQIARKEMFERENEFWAQLLIVLWNEAHKNLYIGFRDRVATINEDVEKVDAIEDDIAGTWIDEMLEDDTLEDLLLCVHLNEVRFSDAFVRTRLEAPLEIERSQDLPMPTGAPEESNPEEEAEADAEAEAATPT
jgi:hypothetical protein